VAYKTPLRVVIDTNVVFEGLTKQGGAAGLVMDSWLAGFFQTCVSNSLAYEYADVLSRKLSERRWQAIKPILGKLLTMSEFVTIYYSWRPMSPDPGDEHVIDCVMNAGAILVTNNGRDFKMARESLGLKLLTPVQLLVELSK
jgi:putative PIN family toxin of toxin-antitoxin system